MENPIKMDDLGVPLFSETPISIPNSFLGGDQGKTGWFHKGNPLGGGSSHNHDLPVAGVRWLENTPVDLSRKWCHSLATWNILYYRRGEMSPFSRYRTLTGDSESKRILTTNLSAQNGENFWRCHFWGRSVELSWICQLKSFLLAQLFRLKICVVIQQKQCAKLIPNTARMNLKLRHLGILQSPLNNAILEVGTSTNARVFIIACSFVLTMVKYDWVACLRDIGVQGSMHVTCMSILYSTLHLHICFVPILVNKMTNSHSQPHLLCGRVSVFLLGDSIFSDLFYSIYSKGLWQRLPY